MIVLCHPLGILGWWWFVVFYNHFMPLAFWVVVESRLYLVQNSETLYNRVHRIRLNYSVFKFDVILNSVMV